METRLNRYCYFSLLAVMEFSILLCFGEIPRLIKWFQETLAIHFF